MHDPLADLEELRYTDPVITGFMERVKTMTLLSSDYVLQTGEHIPVPEAATLIGSKRKITARGDQVQFPRNWFDGPNSLLTEAGRLISLDNAEVEIRGKHISILHGNIVDVYKFTVRKNK